MNVIVDAQLSFERAVAGLRAFRQPKLSEAIYSLGRMQIVTRCASILHALDPQAYLAAALGFTISCLDEDVMELSKIEEQALVEITKHIPIAAWRIEEQILNYEGDCLLLEIEPQGYPIFYDDLYEIGAGDYDPGAYASLPVFIKYLEIGMDQEIWDNASSIFGWDCDYPEYAGSLDWQRFSTMLEERDLGIYKTIFAVCWEISGNPFMDYNPYGEYYQDISLLPFTIESIRDLEPHWQEAKPMIEACSQAIDHAEANPGVYAELLDIFTQAFCPQENRPSTLAELFSEEAL